MAPAQPQSCCYRFSNNRHRSRFAARHPAVLNLHPIAAWSQAVDDALALRNDTLQARHRNPHTRCNELAQRHRLDMLTPLLTISKAMRCTRCGAPKGCCLVFYLD